MATQTGSPAKTARASVSTLGVQANGESTNPALSANGRYVAFVSTATNLVIGDKLAQNDIFVRDLLTGIVVRVSSDFGGGESNQSSYGPDISADGRYVVFRSDATDLVAGETNKMQDIFLRDMLTGFTQRLSMASSTVEANGGSFGAVLSSDGRFTAFRSDATNLVAGDTNGTSDIFLVENHSKKIERISVALDGGNANGFSDAAFISGDGRFVAYHSLASNLIAKDANNLADIFVRDRLTGKTEIVSLGLGGSGGNGAALKYPSLSADGRFVVFSSLASNLVAGDTNGAADVFVYDRQTGVTERVSVASDGAQGNAQSSLAPKGSISADGRYVAFVSSASNLVADDTNGSWDVFIHDRKTGATWRASVADDGSQANGLSNYTALSADGSTIAFLSFATNLVAGDSNGLGDIYVRSNMTSTTPTTPAPTQFTDLVLRGGALDDILTGKGGNDQISGGGGNDKLNGGAGTDILFGGAGDDVVNGGSGQDRAGWRGEIRDYGFYKDAMGRLHVEDHVAGRDGNDTVIDIEQFTFGTHTYALSDVLLLI